jgi:hypothetical protein
MALVPGFLHPAAKANRLIGVIDPQFSASVTSLHDILCFLPARRLTSENDSLLTEIMAGNSGDAKLHILTSWKTFRPFYDLIPRQGYI